MTQRKADNYFAIVPEWVLFSDISPQALRLYAILQTYADRDTGKAWPSRKKLAENLKVKSIPPVDAAIKELVNIGALQVIPRFIDNTQTSNMYTIITANPYGGVNETLLPPVLEDLPGSQEIFTQTRTNKLKPFKQEKEASPNGLGINNLVALYFDNFAEGYVKPSGATVAGQIKTTLKQIEPEVLAELLPVLASYAKPISSTWLNWAKEQNAPKVSKTTAKLQQFLAKYSDDEPKAIASERKML